MTFSIKYTKQETQHDGSAVILRIIMLSVANKPFMLSVIMLNVLIMTVVAVFFCMFVMFLNFQCNKPFFLYNRCSDQITSVFFSQD
jgi:hypothetical protein